MTAVAYVAAVVVVGSYLAFAAGRLPARAYHVANVVGAGPLIVQACRSGAIPSAVVSAVYAVGGAVGLVRSKKSRRMT